MEYENADVAVTPAAEEAIPATGDLTTILARFNAGDFGIYQKAVAEIFRCTDAEAESIVAGCTNYPLAIYPEYGGIAVLGYTATRRYYIQTLDELINDSSELLNQYPDDRAGNTVMMLIITAARKYVKRV